MFTHLIREVYYHVGSDSAGLARPETAFLIGSQVMLALLIPKHTEGPRSRPGFLMLALQTFEAGSCLVGLSCARQDV